MMFYSFPVNGKICLLTSTNSNCLHYKKIFFLLNNDLRRLLPAVAPLENDACTTLPRDFVRSKKAQRCKQGIVFGSLTRKCPRQVRVVSGIMRASAFIDSIWKTINKGGNPYGSTSIAKVSFITLAALLISLCLKANFVKRISFYPLNIRLSFFLLFYLSVFFNY